MRTEPSASPSCVDEETFVRSFCRSDWAIMFILAQVNYSVIAFVGGACSLWPCRRPVLLRQGNR